MKMIAAVWAVSLCLATQAAGAFGFDPYQTYDIGDGAEAVVVGDVDGDGRDDVVLTGSSGGNNSVFVFFQRADGSLDPPVILDYHWQYSDSSLALADFNHDGIEDFVVGSNVGITLFMGNNGRELSGTQINGPAAPLLAAMDVDRDGHVDVMAASWGQGAYITIYYGNGDGGIRERSQLPAPQDPVFGFKVGDLNSDGFEDLAVTTSNLYIYLHDQVSGFNPTPEVIWPYNGEYIDIGGTAIGDFNDDGRNDVVIGKRANSPTNISIYMQSATRTKRDGPVDFVTNDLPMTMLSDDLDGDGRDDLVVMHGRPVGLYLQGDTGLQPEILTDAHYSMNPTGMALGDINGDGCKDLAIASYFADLVVLHGNDCEVRPDLMVALGLTSATAAIRLEHIWGETPIQEPLVQLDLSVLSGALQTGTLPDGCVVQAQTERTRRIECLAATLDAGTNATLIIPINVTGGGQSNPLHAVVGASTDTLERSLANNQATKSILLNPDTRVPVPSTRLRSVIGQ